MNTYRPEGPTPWGTLYIPVSNAMQAHLIKRARRDRTTVGMVTLRAIRDTFNAVEARPKCEHTWTGHSGRLVLAVKLRNAEVERIKIQAEQMGEDHARLIIRALEVRYGKPGRAAQRNNNTLSLDL